MAKRNKNKVPYKEKSLPVQQFGTGFLFLCSVKTDSKKRNVMETKKRTTPKMNLLSAVEQVVELSKGSQQ